MFHRVKSEGQEPEQEVVTGQDEQEAKKEAKVEETKAEDAKDSDDTASLYTEDEPTISESKSSTATQSQEKDEDNTMSEQDNATADQDDTPTTGMSPYQRPGQAPVRSAGGYPGSSSYPGMGGMASGNASDSDRRLTIGPGITMSGEIESCDYLLVEGTVEAALKGANLLEVAESGVFYGTVEISEANISGRFEGDITVNGRLTITSTGTVTGSISYKEIEIEAGAVLDGKLTPLAASSAAAPAKKPAAPAKPAAKPSAKVEKQPEPANSDGELFSKTAAAAE